jgi:hypothetical protein
MGWLVMSKKPIEMTEAENVALAQIAAAAIIGRFLFMAVCVAAIAWSADRKEERAQSQCAEVTPQDRGD